MSDSNFSNNLRAGIFISTILVLALAVGFVLLKVDLFKKYQTFVLQFDTTEGVSGLSRGSEVKVGGLTVGRVMSITPDVDKNDDLAAINVTIQIMEGISNSLLRHRARRHQRGSDSRWQFGGKHFHHQLQHAGSSAGANPEKRRQTVGHAWQRNVDHACGSSQRGAHQ